MRITCRITKAADTRSEYVTLIDFPRQQWLRERSLILRLYVHVLLNVIWFHFLLQMLRPVTVEASPFGICVEQSDSEAGFSPSTLLRFSPVAICLH
jgi:hypothetical protein